MPITKEEQLPMKYLKIEDNKGYFLNQDGGVTPDWIEIDKIGKDELQYLLNKAVTEGFEMDEFKEENLANKAHLIIYRNLYEKFFELLGNKNRFKSESENLYKTALDKYTSKEQT